MERQALKRSRSLDDDTFGHQTKVYVNKIMTEKSDQQKMQDVHEKTRKLLYDGIRALVGVKPITQQVGLCAQYYLRGDGTITLRSLAANSNNNNNDADEEKLERKNSKCCRKLAIIHDECINCVMPLCEECGYSCDECEQFICRSCVTLFGNSIDDHPLCEKCQMFYD